MLRNLRVCLLDAAKSDLFNRKLSPVACSK